MSFVLERVEKVSLRPLQRRLAGETTASQSGPAKPSWLRDKLLFIVMVGAPVLLATLHFGFLASDIYISEAKYVVRTPTDSKGSPLGGVVQSTGISKATDDAHAINAFFLSREAMEILRSEAGLDRAYSSTNIDFLSRFPGPFEKPTNEALFKYYQSMTKVKYDKATGITTLTIQAFEPATTQQIARRLMQSGEAMANRLTVRMREDLVNRAKAEADFARSRAYQAQAKITEWRNREAQIDPTKFSVAIIEVIARLSLELAQLRAQVAEIQKVAPGSPNLGSYLNRAASLEAQIDQERRSLAGGNASLAPKIVEFEQLQLERQFAEKLFEAAVASQESARADAQKQQIYMEWVAEPPMPDYPRRPQRLLSIAIVGSIAFMFYLIASKILKNIARHGAFARYFKQTKR